MFGATAATGFSKHAMNPLQYVMSSTRRKFTSWMPVLGLKLHRLPTTRAHRARADVQMTYHLWRKMDADVRRQFGGVPLTFALMAKLQRARRDQLQLAVDRYLSTGARGAIGT